MATISEDYVSFETAALLKKKGFQQLQNNCGYFTTEMVYSIINAVLGSDNFQTICLISGSDVSSGEVCMAYATSGEITRKASNYGFLLSMKLEKIKVNGGWGNMTYSIWVEGELPIQDRQEFQRVYWGYTFT